MKVFNMELWKPSHIRKYLIKNNFYLKKMFRNKTYHIYHINKPLYQFNIVGKGSKPPLKLVHFLDVPPASGKPPDQHPNSHHQHHPEYFLRRQLALLNNLTNFPVSVTECCSSFINLWKFPLFCKTWEALCRVRNVPASPCKCYGIF